MYNSYLISVIKNENFQISKEHPWREDGIEEQNHIVVGKEEVFY